MRQSLSSQACARAESYEQIRFQMEELRSSSKAELLKAWAEIEQLEDEKNELERHQISLTNLLQASTDREDALQRQVETLLEREELQHRQPTARFARENPKPNHTNRNNQLWNSKGLESAGSSCSTLSMDSMRTDSFWESCDPVMGDPKPRSSSEIPSGWKWIDIQRTFWRQRAQRRMESQVPRKQQDNFSKADDKIQVARAHAQLQSMEEGRQRQMESMEQILHQLQVLDSYAHPNEVAKQEIKINDFKTCIQRLPSDLEQIT